MTEFAHETPRITDQQLDRLVDGELNAPEREAVLLGLEQDPDGWRRCALAFLEAQAWRTSAMRFGQPEAVSRAADRPTTPLPRLNRGRVGAAVWLLAACLLAGVFGLGWGAGSWTSRETPPLLADRPDPGPLDAVPSVPNTALSDESVLPEPDVRPAAEPMGYVRLASNSGGAGTNRSIDVPVLAGPGLDESWLRNQPPFLPDAIRKQWEDRGYQVESHRQLISVQMDPEGRYLAIPVDKVWIQPIHGSL